MQKIHGALLLAVAMGAAASCAVPQTEALGVSSGEPTAPSVVTPPHIPPDAFVTLKSPGDAHADLCQPDDLHPNFPDDADAITRAFCQDLKPGGVVPTPHGLADLQALLGLEFADRTGQNGAGGNPAFAILGHSSALTARNVSSIVPTAFVFTPPPADGSPPVGFAALAFDPGEQIVEVAVEDPTVSSVNFYLVLFDQACTDDPAGCTTTDLLTPRLVTGWSNVRVYEDTTTLNDTVLDCHECHDPHTTGNNILRMQEIVPPYTHFFDRTTEGGRSLLADFHAAHGAHEDYGPIPAALVDLSDPSKLAALVSQMGFADQPNAFDSKAIESDVMQSSPLQPATNVPCGSSFTWQALYERAIAGEFIATPYHDVKVTDPGKLTSMASAYQAWMSGAALEVPDIRDVLLDEGLRDMGFAPKLGLDGRGLLVQMCQQCHNANLDQTLSRQRFRVDDLDQMSRAEKDLAITRLTMTADTRLVMPPPLFRTITPAERELMVQELQQ